MTLSVRTVAFILLAFFAGAAAAQYQPQVGQAGKDVIWVPTPDEVVDRMLTMAQVTPQVRIACQLHQGIAPVVFRPHDKARGAFPHQFRVRANGVRKHR